MDDVLAQQLCTTLENVLSLKAESTVCLFSYLDGAIVYPLVYKINIVES